MGEQPSPHILRPFDSREAITVARAAEIAGYSPAHMRRLVPNYDLGRHVGGGAWKVSRVALAAFLDGNAEALAAYHAGNTASAALQSYYARFGLTPPSAGTAA